MCIDRRVFLLSGLAATLVTGARAEVATGRVGANAPVGSVFDDMWTRYKAGVQRIAGDALQLDWLIRGEAGSEERMVADARRNRLQIVSSSGFNLTGIVPEYGITIAPYLFATREHGWRVFQDTLTDVFRPMFRERGLHLIRWLEVGAIHLYADRPILRPEDARGVRLRAPSALGPRRFLEALGADVISLSNADLIPGLQTGLVDGGVGDPVMVNSYRGAGISDFTLTGHAYDMAALLANADWYDTLESTQRGAVDYAFGPVDEMKQLMRVGSDGALTALRQSGVTLHMLTPEQRAAFAAAAEGVADRMAQEIGGRAPQILATIRDATRRLQ